MGTYDTKRLDVAIQYIRRMAEGRNPVTNRPAPENEVLNNANVNRCLNFVKEILEDVRSAGGTVGVSAGKTAAPRPSVAGLFPYEVLAGFHYERDQQISYLLKQIGELLPEEKAITIQATLVTDWLRDNGYLEKRMLQEIGKESSVPTEKGTELGIYSEKAGTFPNEYFRIYYNEKAQRFIIDHFKQILTETTEKRANRRKEKRMASRGEKQRDTVKETGPERKKAQEQAVPQSSAFEEDPGLASLLSSIPAEYAFSQNPDADPSSAVSAYDDFMGDGWQSADDGIPW